MATIEPSRLLPLAFGSNQVGAPSFVGPLMQRMTGHRHRLRQLRQFLHPLGSDGPTFPGTCMKLQPMVLGSWNFFLALLV